MKKFLFLFPIIFLLFTSIPSYAGTYELDELSSTDALNDTLIANWNSLPTSKKELIIRQMFPTIKKKLGIYTDMGYDQFENVYQTMKEQNLLGDYCLDSDGVFYPTFIELLYEKIIPINNSLVMQSDASKTTGSIAKYIARDEIEVNGIQNLTVKKYSTINSGVFTSLDIYNTYIAECRNHLNLGYEYCTIARSAYSGTYTFAFFKGNVLREGTAGNYRLTTNGENYNCEVAFVYVNSSNVIIDRSSSWGAPLFYLGGAGGPVASINGYANYNQVIGTLVAPLFVLANNDLTINIYTSLTGWKNGNGHFEPTITFNPNVDNSPSLTFNSRDLTQTYYNIYNNTTGTGSGFPTDSTTIDINNIIYPPNYTPTYNYTPNDNYVVDFSEPTNFLESIGNFIGSLINSISTGLANLLDSVVSLVRNIGNFFLNNPFADFIKAFLNWLPEPFNDILYGLFTISISFGILRLVKGAFG